MVAVSVRLHVVPERVNPEAHEYIKDDVSTFLQPELFTYPEGHETVAAVVSKQLLPESVRPDAQLLLALTVAPLVFLQLKALAGSLLNPDGHAVLAVVVTIHDVPDSEPLEQL